MYILNALWISVCVLVGGVLWTHLDHWELGSLPIKFSGLAGLILEQGDVPKMFQSVPNFFYTSKGNKKLQIQEVLKILHFSSGSICIQNHFFSLKKASCFCSSKRQQRIQYFLMDTDVLLPIWYSHWLLLEIALAAMAGGGFKPTFVCM